MAHFLNVLYGVRIQYCILYRTDPRTKFIQYRTDPRTSIVDTALEVRDSEHSILCPTDRGNDPTVDNAVALV
jgi:hypothetical protein